MFDKLPTEFSLDPGVNLKNPEVDFAVTVSSLPPHLQKYYEETSTSAVEDSDFFKRLESLVKECKKNFSGPPPKFFSELWGTRKQELNILESALGLVKVTHADIPLLNLCRVIADQSRFTFARFKSWNALPYMLKNLLHEFMDDKTLSINFNYPVQDKIFHSFCKTIVNYQLLHSQLSEVRAQLELCKSDESLKTCVEKYLATNLLRDTVQESLRSDKQQLEIESKRLKDKDKDLSIRLKSYERQNIALRNELKRLKKEIEDHILSKRESEEKNELLNLRVARLVNQNNYLTTLLKLRHQELQTAKSELKEVRLRHNEISKENEELKSTTVILNSELAKRSKQVVELKIGSNMGLERKREVQKFREAAVDNQKDLVIVKSKLKTIAEKFDTHSRYLEDMPAPILVR